MLIYGVTQGLCMKRYWESDSSNSLVRLVGRLLRTLWFNPQLLCNPCWIFRGTPSVNTTLNWLCSHSLLVFESLSVKLVKKISPWRCCDLICWFVLLFQVSQKQVIVMNQDMMYEDDSEIASQVWWPDRGQISYKSSIYSIIFELMD